MSNNNVVMIDHSDASPNSIRLPSTLDSQRAKSGLSQHTGSRLTQMIDYHTTPKRTN
jgi:hypothetical protein